jgi:hypothetical protein
MFPAFAEAFVSVANTAVGMDCDCESVAATAEVAMKIATNRGVIVKERRFSSGIKFMGFLCTGARLRLNSRQSGETIPRTAVFRNRG